jgi:hypothetical protein
LHYINAKFEIKCLMEESRKMTYGRLAGKNCVRSDSVTIRSNNVPMDSFGISWYLGGKCFKTLCKLMMSDIAFPVFNIKI